MVGVDQAQIDKILAGVSTDDPEARLDALERELDFVKTSIKRLLIDLRERMNELDNPFTSAATYTGSRLDHDLLTGETDTDHAPDDAPMSSLPDTEALQALPAPGPDRSLFPAEIPEIPTDNLPAIPPAKPAGKLKLQKVHRLFEWVHQGCRKYGHEHMTIMIDAYQSMGYITDEVSDQVRDIMRMAPRTRKDVQEIGPNEFVSELYVLNRILDPDDATLDRDMIEVLMLSKRRPDEQGTGKPASRERDAGDAWIELLDRI
ncbi:MAG: hypothetical protein GX216_03850 [Methanomicrobiales archaeon]|nr:hypothetical protein [Methanomicrobiales archaeon]